MRNPKKYVQFDPLYMKNCLEYITPHSSYNDIIETPNLFIGLMLC